jgi:UDP-N-acetylglucosamine--dolichyl-phosphate N-acetylglucosaminephosphotransferase
MTVLDYHKENKPQIPRPGGPAIIAAVVVCELSIFGLTGNLSVLGLSLVTLISGTIGVVDDLKTLGGIAKPALLLIGGIPLLALQYFFPNAVVYNHHLYLPLFSTPTNIPLIYPLLVLVAIPVVTNTINTIDVLNGVVSGFILIAFVPVLLGMSVRLMIGKEEPVVFISIFPVIAAAAAFYLFHKFPSRIFPGDSGAMALGAAYGTIAIIGGVEVVAVIAILPAIMNSFFFLSSVKRLVEHRDLKSQPTLIQPDGKIAASHDPKAPVTLMRLLVSGKPKTEKEIGRDILILTSFSSFLAILTVMMTWVITIA